MTYHDELSWKECICTGVTQNMNCRYHATVHGRGLIENMLPAKRLKIALMNKVPVQNVILVSPVTLKK